MKVSGRMRIAILSDIHGNDVAFEAVVRDMESYKVNYVIFLGDLVAKGPQPQACYQRMLDLQPMVWLKGNTEYWLDNAMVEVMPTSPANIKLLAYYDYMVKNMDGPSMDALIDKKPMTTIQMGHFEGICCHGSLNSVEEAMDPINDPEHVKEILTATNVAFVLSGHSHQQYDQVLKGVRMINPGAVGLANEGDEGMARYAIMEVGASFKVDLRQVPYEVEALQAVISERKFMIEQTGDAR